MKRQGWVSNRLTLVSLALFVFLAHMQAHNYLFNKQLSTQTNLFIPDNTAIASRLCSRHREVLYGIFSIPTKAKTWTVARQQQHCEMNNEMHQTVFVVGSPRTTSDQEIIINESKAHGDVFILSCEENMNEGKTFFYFKEALEQFPCFNFYAKVDDDTAFTPQRLSARISVVPNNEPLLIGRNSKILDTIFDKYIGKSMQFFYRDMTWYHSLQNYTAGMLYILNTQAVKRWTALKSVQLYGDEDFRTTYYMTLIGAKVVNLDTTFHDYMKYETHPYQDHWKLEITHDSLAVHKCKSLNDLSDAFAAICTA